MLPQDIIIIPTHMHTHTLYTKNIKDLLHVRNPNFCLVTCTHTHAFHCRVHGVDAGVFSLRLLMEFICSTTNTRPASPAVRLPWEWSSWKEHRSYTPSPATQSRVICLRSHSRIASSCSTQTKGKSTQEY